MKPLREPATRNVAVPAAVVLAALAGFALLFLSFTALPDGDSYFHLAASRLYAHGIPHGLPWARFSLQREGWGDDALLFHLALVPFAGGASPAAGGRLALALLNAGLAATLALLGRRALGNWGLLAPLFVYLLPAGFLPRAARLRPELLAAILLLLAVDFAARRRHAALGVVAALFALTAPTFWLLPALGAAWMLLDRRVLGAWQPRVLLVPLAGTAAGLLIHPHFPKVLGIAWIRGSLFAGATGLDVASELLPPGLRRLALDDVLLAFALLLVALATRPASEPPGAERDRCGPYFAIAAFALLALYAASARYVLWAVPCIVLAIAFGIRHRERRLGTAIELGRGRVPVAPLLVVVAALALPALVDPALVRLLRRQPPNPFEAELARFGALLPPGARVAAPWRDADLYVFAAPGARFLGVLDPRLMVRSHPGLFEVQRSLFAGREADVPLALARLDSEYLAFSRAAAPAQLAQRLEGDPRLEVLARGGHLLARRSPAAGGRLVLDWTEAGTGRRYPRLEEAAPRAAEGFVDLGRFGLPAKCVTVRRGVLLEQARELRFTFAPWGSGVALVDGRLVAGSETPRWGIFTDGIAVRQPLAAGRHAIEVRTCAADGRTGFYLRSDP